MTVEQTLKVLDEQRKTNAAAAKYYRKLAESFRTTFQHIYATQKEEQAAQYQEVADALASAIAIIKAAQEFKQAREDALDASDDNFEQAVARAEEKRDVLFSLLSPDQPKKEA